MRLKIAFSILIICGVVMLFFVNPSQAVTQEEYEIEIKFTTSCLLPFQSVFPISCDVELTNMGNEPFNGTLRIECETKEGYFAHKDFPVSNLAKADVQHFTARFSTDHAGRYWITVKLEEDSLDKIYLYEDSRLVDEANRVKTQDSIFFRSFSEFIAIMAIVVGAIVSIVVAVYMKKK